MQRRTRCTVAGANARDNELFFLVRGIQIYESVKVNVQRQVAYLSVQRHHANTDLSLSFRVEKLAESLRDTFNHQKPIS